MFRKKYFKLESKISLFLQKRSLSFLRYSLGIIYIWYGFLKVIGISPAEELVEHATHWLGVHEFVRLLGIWEIAIGFCFIVQKYIRIALLLFLLHLPGTFLPLFLNPEDCFTIIPYGLTLEGQYIFKNLISIGAVLTIIASLHSKK